MAPRFLTRAWHAALLPLLAATMAAAPAHAEFPERPIKVVSPFAPGNTLDIPLLQASEYLRQKTGQQLIIEHRPGAASMVATQQVAKAQPDGYTLLLGPMGAFVINPHTYSKLPYSPDKGFVPVTNFIGSPLLLVVNADVPARSLAELVAQARKNPGELSYASFGAGNSSHFAGALLSKRAGIEMLHVPYNGTPLAVQALLSAQVKAAFIPYIAAKAHIESGRIRPLAFTGGARAPELPQVPTFAELGYPELEINMWTGLFAPAGTPPAVVSRLNKLLVEAMKDKALVDRIGPYGLDALPTTVDEFSRFIAAESAKWKGAVELTGFKAQE